jgi:hypothetical protein
LVLAAFGLLIAALTTAETLWAWISVVVSVAAAALLVMDWLNGRRNKGSTERPARPSVVTVGGSRHRQPEPDVYEDEPDDEDLFPDDPRLATGPATVTDLAVGGGRATGPAGPTSPDAERTGVIEPVAPVHDGVGRVDDVDDAGFAAGPEPDTAPDREPDEEPTDASDLLVVAGLNVEVRVVDERPRYHLATCVWLANRPTIPIPVSEARQLGFTPCARCGPDSVLAARHRAAR